MATKDREYFKVLVRDRFFKVGRVLERAAAAKDTYRAEVSKLNGDSSRSMYAADHLKKLKEEALQKLAAELEGLNGDFEKRLEELQAALVEAHSFLDLQNPALVNAIALIRALGAELDAETIGKINTQFAGDQSSLRVLRGAFEAAGVTWHGLDKLVYSPERAITEMQEAGWKELLRGDALTDEGSINRLARVVGKYAKLEGYADFETSPDRAGADKAFLQAVRRGAGLPDA